MTRLSAFAAVLGVILLLVFSEQGWAQQAAAATSAEKGHAFSTSDSTIGELLDNPATHAVLQKDVPNVVTSPQIDQARDMTLVAIQPYAPADLTDAVLAKIDADLAKIPSSPAK